MLVMDIGVMELERGSVRAEVSYVRDARPDADTALAFVTENESRSTMVTQPGFPVPIDDVRGVRASRDREGFELVSRKSKVPDFDLIEWDRKPINATSRR